MNNYLPESLVGLIKNLQYLPGVGEKTAQRLAFFLLKKDDEFLKKFGDSVSFLKDKITECSNCFNFTENEKCDVCNDINRNNEVLCVVENPFDVISIEKSGVFKGRYHILHGVLSPLDGVGPDKLKISELLIRLKEGKFTEIILAINPSLEGEATSIYISRKIAEKGIAGIKITVLAKGISVGGDLEYTDELTLGKALENRISF